MKRSRRHAHLAQTVKIFLFTFCWCCSSNAQIPGDLDPSFGLNGKLTFWIGGNPWGGGLRQCPDAALLPDGKILQFGYGTYDGSWIVVRYDKNGGVDTSFGNAGKSIIPMPVNNYASAVNAMEVLANGKILLAGAIRSLTTENDGAIVRLNADGTIDPTFGNAGYVQNITIDDFMDMKLQVDGKIVVLGNTYNLQTDHSVLTTARYNVEGTLDSTFSADGIQVINFGYDVYKPSLCIQPDGKIIVIGTNASLDPLSPPVVKDILIARLQSNGILDQSFGLNGKIVTSTSAFPDYPVAGLIQADGKLLMVGNWFLMRYLINGTLDNTFGNSGVIIIDPAVPIIIHDATFQSDGKIIVCGEWVDGNYSSFFVGRFNPDGAFDQTFGTGGTVKTDFFGYLEAGEKILVQPDGKIVISGETEYDFALARYLTGLNVGLIEPDGNTVSNYIYPNLVRESLSIEYELQEQAKVNIYLIDLYGSALKSIVTEEIQQSGKHKISTTLSDDLAPGIFFLKISAGTRSAVVKILKE